MADTGEHDNKASFDGFEIPEQNWFKLPNRWTDITCEMSSLAELKVVEYVLRHTWGFQEYGAAKRISINEFMHGRRRSDGSRIDCGTGLSKQSVIDGLKKAVEHGYLIEVVDHSDKGRIKKSYSLRMRATETHAAQNANRQLPAEDLDSDVKNLDRGGKNLDTRGQESRHRSKKDTLERNTTGTGENLAAKLKRLPDNDLNEDEVKLLVNDITTNYGDREYEPLNHLVARKLQRDDVLEIISSIRQDETVNNPGAVFNHRITRLADQQLDGTIKNRLTKQLKGKDKLFGLT